MSIKNESNNDESAIMHTLKYMQTSIKMPGKCSIRTLFLDSNKVAKARSYYIIPSLSEWTWSDLF